MAITVTYDDRVSGSLFEGTDQYIYALPSAPTAGQGVVIAISNGNVRNVLSATLGSTGTTTSFTSVASLAGAMAMLHCTATGSETNSNIVINLSGNANDQECFGVLVASGWSSDQSGATGISESSASATSHDIGAITPATAHNLIVFFSSRGNRDWIDDSDYTMVEDTTNTFAFAYRIQSAANADTYSFSTLDTAGGADMLLGAFSGEDDVEPPAEPSSTQYPGKIVNVSRLMNR